ncbi:MAG TPA: two component system sensor protein [Desulfobacteraceae bacterium]|nr:two component system sensor protein [Desulfobacteraceae bacterium]
MPRRGIALVLLTETGPSAYQETRTGGRDRRAARRSRRLPIGASAMHERYAILADRGAAARIILPVVLTIVLFGATIFIVFLPMIENRMMAGKREMIRDLTETAWSSLAAYERAVRAGRLTGDEARAQAIAHLRELRYGPELKDYFWINDMHPRLLMHPYRQDLEGSDISNYADPNGKRLFVEFVRTVRQQGAGYVDYQWQWKDDPAHIVPKISYVKGFAPWGWIVGTGIYVEDVRAEMAAITRQLTWTITGILAMVIALSAYIVWQGLAADRRRRQAQALARQQQEQLFQAGKLASIGTLVSGIAHEINNPITAIVLNAQTLDKIWRAIGPQLDREMKDRHDLAIGGLSYANLRERMPLLLGDIVDGARRVRSIVTDLKDFARQGPSDLNEDVDVNESVRRAVALTENLIKKATHHFDVELADDMPTIRGNRQRIEQVLVNLLVNACQALSDPAHSVRVATAFDAARNEVIVTVSDEGEGIAEDLLERVKDPFFTTKRDQGGTGLGLALSNRIVEDHGGRLTLTPRQPRGTVATIVLPVGPGAGKEVA